MCFEAVETVETQVLSTRRGQQADVCVLFNLHRPTAGAPPPPPPPPPPSSSLRCSAFRFRVLSRRCRRQLAPPPPLPPPPLLPPPPPLRHCIDFQPWLDDHILLFLIGKMARGSQSILCLTLARTCSLRWCVPCCRGCRLAPLKPEL